MTSPLYQIFRITPTHCQITDGIIGSQAMRLPMAYHLLPFAQKLAGRLSEQDERDCGDDYFRVVRVGRGPFDRDPIGDGGVSFFRPTADDMECPF